jgi:hypothetical protein
VQAQLYACDDFQNNSKELCIVVFCQFHTEICEIGQRLYSKQNVYIDMQFNINLFVYSKPVKEMRCVSKCWIRTGECDFNSQQEQIFVFPPSRPDGLCCLSFLLYEAHSGSFMWKSGNI